MKIAAPAILLACAVAIAAPASAASISLSKGVQLCKAELGKQTPPLKSFFVDMYDTSASKTHLWVAFKVRTDDDRRKKLVCVVDLNTRTVQITGG